MTEQEYIEWLRAHPPRQNDAKEIINTVNQRIDALGRQEPRSRLTVVSRRGGRSRWDLGFRLSLSTAVAILLTIGIGQTLTVSEKYTALEQRMHGGQKQPLQLSIMYDIPREAFQSLAAEQEFGSPMKLLQFRRFREGYRIARSETEGMRFYRAMRFSWLSRVGDWRPVTHRGSALSLHLHSITITLGITSRG